MDERVFKQKSADYCWCSFLPFLLLNWARFNFSKCNIHLIAFFEKVKHLRCRSGQLVAVLSKKSTLTSSASKAVLLAQSKNELGTLSFSAGCSGEVAWRHIWRPYRHSGKLRLLHGRACLGPSTQLNWNWRILVMSSLKMNITHLLLQTWGLYYKTLRIVFFSEKERNWVVL